jgi:multiple sugar transport system permease protein
MNRSWLMKQRIYGYFFIGPSVIGVIIFFLLPALFSLYLAFMDWDFSSKTKTFIGFGNFVRLFNDDIFYVSLKNTLIFLGAVPVTVLLSFFVAVILNQSVYLKNYLRTMMFLPYITSSVAISFVWMLLFQPKEGPVNQFLRGVGFATPPGWFASTDSSMLAVDIIWIWYLLGYNMIIYLAALQEVPNDLLEASTIDGANVWQRLRFISIPLVSPTTLFLMITGFIVTIKNFGIIQAITEGGPGNSTSVLSLFVYKTAFRYYQMGYASAISWVLFGLILVITVIQWRLQKRWVHY